MCRTYPPLIFAVLPPYVLDRLFGHLDIVKDGRQRIYRPRIHVEEGFEVLESALGHGACALGPAHELDDRHQAFDAVVWAVKLVRDWEAKSDSRRVGQLVVFEQFDECSEDDRVGRYVDRGTGVGLQDSATSGDGKDGEHVAEGPAGLSAIIHGPSLRV